MPHFEVANSNILECRFNRLSRVNVSIFNLQVFIVKDKILTFDIKEIVQNTLSTLMDINQTNIQNLLPQHLAFHGMGFYFKRPLSGKYRWKDMPTNGPQKNLNKHDFEFAHSWFISHNNFHFLLFVKVWQLKMNKS